MIQTLINVLGIVGILASIIGFQTRKHQQLMVCRTTNEMAFGIQYILLGAYTGAAMNFIGCLRNILFSRLVKKNRSTIPLRITFSLLFCAFAYLTRDGIKSALIALAKVISTVAYGTANLFFARVTILVSSTIWLIYNLFVRSYAGAFNEVMTIASIIIGILRIDIPNLKRKGNENIEI